jgi:hypothetical protein
MQNVNQKIEYYAKRFKKDGKHRICPQYAGELGQTDLLKTRKKKRLCSQKIEYYAKRKSKIRILCKTLKKAETTAFKK